MFDKNVLSTGIGQPLKSPSILKSPENKEIPLFSMRRPLSASSIQNSVMAMFQGGNLNTSVTTPINLPPNVADIVKKNIAAFKKNLALALQHDPNFIQNNPGIIPAMQKMYQLSPSQMADIPGIADISPVQAGFPTEFSKANKPILTGTSMYKDMTQSSLSLLTVSSTISTTMATTATSVGSSIKAFSMVNQISTEDHQRRLDMKKQLDFQKQWIDDHNVKKKVEILKQFSNPITNIDTIETDIDKRIELLNEEINELKRKKELQTLKRGHCEQNDYSKSAEENVPRLESDLGSKMSSQFKIDHRLEPTAMKLKSFEYDRLSPKRRLVNFYETEKKDAFLMNQLQTKHDESDSQSRAAYEIKRLREIAELKRLCAAEREGSMSKNRDYMQPSLSEYTSHHRPSSYSHYERSYSSHDGVKRDYRGDAGNKEASYRNQYSPSYDPNLSSSSISPRSTYYKASSPPLSGNGSARKKPCAKCGMNAFFLCSECRCIWYCSPECQLADWKFHARSCTKRHKSQSSSTVPISELDRS